VVLFVTKTAFSLERPCTDTVRKALLGLGCPVDLSLMPARASAPQRRLR